MQVKHQDIFNFEPNNQKNKILRNNVHLIFAQMQLIADIKIHYIAISIHRFYL